MAQTAQSKPRRIDEAEGGLDPTFARKARKWAFIAVAVLLVAATWFIWHQVNQGRKADRWEALSRIERPYASSASDRSWLEPASGGSTFSEVDSRAEHIKKLEDFLAREGADDDAIAAHVHAKIADLELTQYIGLVGGGSTDPDVSKHLDAAQKHAEALRDEERFADAIVNRSQFASQPVVAKGGGRRQDAASLPRMLLQRIQTYREWDAKHGVKKVEPDADPVVLLRTTEGDLRLQLFSRESPRLVAAFLERACAGGLAGVRIFERRDDSTGSWVRVGDDRTKDKPDAKPPTDDERIAWEDDTPGEPRLPDGGRYRILATAGVVCAWHGPGETDDDPQQFQILWKDSPELNFTHTPFARVTEAQSLETLKRVTERPTIASDEAGLKSNPKRSRITTQLKDPVVVVRALVYEHGKVKDCPGAAGADASEKSLDTLVRDERRVKPPPAPAPATPPPAATPSTPPPTPTPPAPNPPADGEGMK